VPCLPIIDKGMPKNPHNQETLKRRIKNVGINCIPIRTKKGYDRPNI
jgi:hypothetical protein